MKKSHLRSFVWSLLTVVSLACYGFLNHYTPESEMGFEQNNPSYVAENPESDFYLLEIALVKKLLNVTKMVVPKE